MKLLKCIIIFIFISIITQIQNISATCVTSSYRCNGAADDFIVHPTQITETIDGKTYKTYVMQRQYSEKYVYCLQKGLNAPHVAYGLTDPNYCTSENFIEENVRAAIGYVINTDYDYATKQHVIHKLMKEAGYGSDPVTYNTTLYNSAKSIRDSYNAAPTVTLGDFSLSGSNYVANYSISGDSGLGNPTVTVNVGSVSDGKVYLPLNTPTSNGEVTVTISISYSKTYSLVITKKCGTYQPIAEQDTTPKSKTYSDTDSKTVSITGKLKVTKTNSSNDVLAQVDESTTVKFKLYNNSSCTGTPVKDFNAGDTVSNLTPGTYYLQEYQAKRGYHLPQSGEDRYCSAVTVTAGETNDITIENKTECEFRFRSDMTMKERIDLYNLIKTNYSHDFNALLDISKITARDACTNITKTKSYNKGCLTSNSNSTNSSSFSETNLSMYTEKYGSYTFCLTKYNLENSLDKTRFNNIKSGQLIIKTDNVVAQATLNRVCYNFGDANNVIPELNYSDYIEKDVTINGVNLEKSSITKIHNNNSNSIKIKKINPTTNRLIPNGASFNLYKGYNCSAPNAIYNSYVGIMNATGQLDFSNLPTGNYSVYEREAFNGVIIPGDAGIVDDASRATTNRCTNIEVDNTADSAEKDTQIIKVGYLLPHAFASNKDGKVSYGSCPSGEYCKELGRGIKSNFNERPNTHDLGFDIQLKESKFGSLTGTFNDCKYTIVNELIDYKSKLHVEFRHVNTDSDALFLGKNGIDDRHIGSNWQSEEDRNYVLKVKNNSFNKNKEEPLYKITLTSELMKEIRGHNKSKTYDDYNMTCIENGTICISNYLTCLEQRRLLTIKDRKNIDLFVDDQVNCVY